MDKKRIVYGAAIILVLLLMLFNLGIININSGGKATDDSASPGGYDSIPEKCRPTAGYTEESWKEHLSHHAETKDCLKYFN